MKDINHKAFLCAGTKALKGLKESYEKKIAEHYKDNPQYLSSFAFQELERHSKVIYPFEKQSIYRNSFGRTLCNRLHTLRNQENTQSSNEEQPVTTQIIFFSSTNALNLTNKESDSYNYLKRLINLLLFPQEVEDFPNFSGQQPIFFVFPGRTTHKFFCKCFTTIYNEVIEERRARIKSEKIENNFFTFNSENYTLNQYLNFFTLYNQEDSGYEGGLKELIRAVFTYYNHKMPGRSINVDFLIDTSMSSTIQHGKVSFKVCAMLGLIPKIEGESYQSLNPNPLGISSAYKDEASLDQQLLDKKYLSSPEILAKENRENKEFAAIDLEDPLNKKYQDLQDKIEKFLNYVIVRDNPILSKIKNLAIEFDNLTNKKNPPPKTRVKNSSHRMVLTPEQQKEMVARRAALAKTLASEDVFSIKAITSPTNQRKKEVTMHKTHELPLIFFALDESFRQLKTEDLKRLYKRNKFKVNENGEFLESLTPYVKNLNKDDNTSFFSLVELRWARRGSGIVSLRLAKLASYFTIPAWSPQLLINVLEERKEEKVKEKSKHNSWIFTESRPFLDLIRSNKFKISPQDHFLLPNNANSKEQILKILGKKTFNQQIHFVKGVSKEAYLKELLEVQGLETNDFIAY